MGKLETLTRAFFTEVWENEDEAAIHRWMTPNLDAKGVLPKDVLGPDEFAAFHRALCALVTDIRISFTQVVESGDWIAVHGRLDGAARATGAPVGFTFHSMARFEGEQFAVGYNALDYIALFEQLGQIDEGALGALLSGAKLARA
ncbi:MAG: nuclear transport factor 2 family protein [Pseudomonadota bacterium]